MGGGSGMERNGGGGRMTLARMDSVQSGRTNCLRANPTKAFECLQPTVHSLSARCLCCPCEVSCSKGKVTFMILISNYPGLK